jgi:hypothetical protein
MLMVAPMLTIGETIGFCVFRGLLSPLRNLKMLREHLPASVWDLESGMTGSTPFAR